VKEQGLGSIQASTDCTSFWAYLGSKVVFLSVYDLWVPNGLSTLENVKQMKEQGLYLLVKSLSTAFT
jgi:hypothetical protein